MLHELEHLRIENATLKERCAQYEKQIQWMQTILNKYTNAPTWNPNTTYGPITTTYGCSVCGMQSDKAMGYVCPRNDCPTKVTNVS